MKLINKGFFIASILIGTVFLIFWLMNPLDTRARIVCSGGDCWETACENNSDCGTNQWTGAQRCERDSIYQNYMTFTCNNPGSADAYCTRSITQRHQRSCRSDQICQYGMCISEGGTGGYYYNDPYDYDYYDSYYRNCVSYFSKRCVGNSVYWFDSCNRQNSLYQTCLSNQTCSNGACNNITYTTTSYNYHAFKGCVNNIVYWYDSQGNQRDVYQNCSTTGQTCQNGQCVGQSYQPTKATPPSTPYALHYLTKCYNNSIYWYDSRGNVQDIYQNCQDNNQCTLDQCQDNKCLNTLKCDTSTCLVGSPDYLKYCSQDQVQDQKKEEKVSAAAVSETPGPSLRGFLKKWYIWVIIIASLAFLFVLIFRRLSSKI